MSQNTEKIFERAKSNFEDENHEHALRLFNEVLNREPSHKKALRSKGLIKVLNDDSEEAEKFLLFAIDQQPQDDQLYQMLGTLYQNNNHPKKALAQFKKATAINSENAIAHWGIGILYAHFFGDHEQAVTHFSLALKINSEESDLLFNRGCSYMILEQMKMAETDLKKAAEMGHSKARDMVDKYFKG